MAYNGYINQNPNQNQPQQQSYFNNINQQTQFQQQNIQPLFPQPQGNVYNINSTLEVANVPVSAGMSVALCLNEGFMYIKTMQNGNPMFWAYKILPYDSSKPAQENEEIIKKDTSPIEEQFKKYDNRFMAIEQQVSDIQKALKENPKGEWKL